MNAMFKYIVFMFKYMVPKLKSINSISIEMKMILKEKKPKGDESVAIFK